MAILRMGRHYSQGTAQHRTKLFFAIPTRYFVAVRELLSSASSRGEAIAVCTIEKANVAINRLVQEDRLGALSGTLTSFENSHKLLDSFIWQPQRWQYACR